MTLPIAPPYPPMEALLVEEIPAGEGWQYEPKSDGFRCLAFCDGDSVEAAVQGRFAAGSVLNPPGEGALPMLPSADGQQRHESEPAAQRLAAAAVLRID